MDFIENINKQYEYYMRGLLTNTEMLQNIANLVQAEMPRRIEARRGKSGRWRPLNDKLYSQKEADEALEILDFNSLGYEFRAVLAK